MDKLPVLKIDPEFKDLIRPLRRKEYLQLEENILDEGCRDPIIIWNDYIIDGHNRYAICTQHSVPFRTITKDFASKDEAIVWICKNQLGRRNITEETRKYLIGRQYESEKIIASIKNPVGKNQHPFPQKQEDVDEDFIPQPQQKQVPPRSKNKTAHIIGADNNITHATVQKYAYYTRALDHIAEQCPELRTKILSGRYKVSHKNVLALEQLSKKELNQLNVRLDRGSQPFVQYSATRSIIENEQPKEESKPHHPSVKDMPEYNPDSSIIQLSLTIPSWITSINRATATTNISDVSVKTKQQLHDVLEKLESAIQNVVNLIKEN